MDQLIEKVNDRLEFGRRKYGHGVRIKDDMSKYTRSNKDSFIEMQLEEILDGIVYTAASKLRWLNNKYDFITDSQYSKDDNSDIIMIVKDATDYITDDFNDEISNDYDRLLSSMIRVYLDTISLQDKLNNLK